MGYINVMYCPPTSCCVEGKQFMTDNEKKHFRIKLMRLRTHPKVQFLHFEIALCTLN